jgi:hypothetical protein
VDIRRLILESIKRLLLSELIRFEEQLKAMSLRQQEILSVISSMQAKTEAELKELRDRVARLEGQYQHVEESLMLKLENLTLKARLLRMLGRRK